MQPKPVQIPVLESRFIRQVLALAFLAISTLIACSSAPALPMAAVSASQMSASEQLAKMDAQLKTMQDVHDMVRLNAEHAEVRSKLMAYHMKSMQDGLKMIGDMQILTEDIDVRYLMNEKRMKMMQVMMDMMTDRLPALAAM
jgi:isocitrate dehydrogenase kinase/phosphatase